MFPQLLASVPTSHVFNQIHHHRRKMVRRRQLRIERLRQRKIERRRQAHDDGPDDKPESSSRRGVDNQDRSNASISKDDPVLQPNHKIFLSHSGYQKDFVEELCGDLEKQYRYPFFDRSPSSLPKGERFPEIILRAARQCQLAVVVLSEEFFTSKRPMIELNTFVQTRLQQEELKSNTKLRILPLFYGVSIVEFGKEERRARWFARWDELAKEDSRVDVKAWKESLKVLALFNGVSYYQDTRAVKAYPEEVVDHICREVPSDVIEKTLLIIFAGKFHQMLNGMIHMFKEVQVYMRCYIFNCHCLQIVSNLTSNGLYIDA